MLSTVDSRGRMGQAVSGGNFSSIFSRSSEGDVKPEARQDNGGPQGVDSIRIGNINSLSCFKSQSDSVDGSQSQYLPVPKVIDNPEPAADFEDNLASSDRMPPTKKFYDISKKDADRRQKLDTQNSNYGIPKRTLNGPEEINGNKIETVQGCSYENSNTSRLNPNNSIDRYISAFFNQNLSLEDDLNKGASDSKRNVKSKNLKRTHKQSKGKTTSRECCGCSKDSKVNYKSNAKKKNAWTMKFCGSKLGKTNAAGGTCSSNLESEAGCVCTSYKKVDFTDRGENSDSDFVELPRIQHNLSLGWASERANINRNSSNWRMVSGGSNVYSQSSRGAECVSCEGSHCHVDLNALAELSNMGGLPINITVARVGNNSSSAGNISTENNVILLSLAAQNSPVIDLTRFNPDDHPLEDCEERARMLRALEIAEGVEPPPGYNSIQVVRNRDLRTLLFQQQLPNPTSLTVQPLPQHARIHTQVDYIHCLVPDLRSITSCSFYWGKMDRYEAERLLDGKGEGTFLLRDSAQEEYLFSVSFRKYQRSLHARIEQFNHKFSFDSHDPGVFTSDTVTGLIEHYKDPSCVMYFEPMLIAPLSRTFTFSLQHLCRAVIVSCTTYDGINQLRLPNGIKTYLKEYHYRQRVRVKRFDETPDVSEESI